MEERTIYSIYSYMLLLAAIGVGELGCKLQALIGVIAYLLLIEHRLS